DRAAAAAKDDKRPVAERVGAARLLGFGPFAVGAAPLQGMLAPTNPGELQLAAGRGLSAQGNATVGELRTSQWGGYGRGGGRGSRGSAARPGRPLEAPPRCHRAEEGGGGADRIGPPRPASQASQRRAACPRREAAGWAGGRRSAEGHR